MQYSPATSNKTLLTKTAIVLKIHSHILQRIYFQVRRTNLIFMSTIRGFFEGGTRGKNASNVFFLNTALLGFSDYFLQFDNLR